MASRYAEPSLEERMLGELTLCAPGDVMEAYRSVVDESPNISEVTTARNEMNIMGV